MPGRFVISLDFELQWGVPERTLGSYGANLRGERLAVPRLLELFEEFEIHATWAIVGFLFARTRGELLSHIPDKRPAYANQLLDPYLRLDEVGADEASDPYHFAASLVEAIAATPYQEIATHTFSHYYCLESGQDLETFESDLAAAIESASWTGRKIRSIIFPRNQVNHEYLGACPRAGILAYRGNLNSWLYEERAQGEESRIRRLMRLLDTYLPLTGNNLYGVPEAPPDGLINLPASRFLRPWAPSLRILEPIRYHRITSSMSRAAKGDRVYHLWWHPHNFGVHAEENFRFLRKILGHFKTLQRDHGMRSISMGELAGETLPT